MLIYFVLLAKSVCMVCHIYWPINFNIEWQKQILMKFRLFYDTNFFFLLKIQFFFFLMMSLFTNNSIKVWWYGISFLLMLYSWKIPFSSSNFDKRTFILISLTSWLKLWFSTKVCVDFLFWSKFPFYNGFFALSHLHYEWGLYHCTYFTKNNFWWNHRHAFI